MKINNFPNCTELATYSPLNVNLRLSLALACLITALLIKAPGIDTDTWQALQIFVNERVNLEIIKNKIYSHWHLVGT